MNYPKCVYIFGTLCITSHLRYYICSKPILILFSRLRLCSRRTLRSDINTKILQAFLVVSMRATCTVHLSLWITLKIYGEEQKLWNPPLCSVNCIEFTYTYHENQLETRSFLTTLFHRLHKEQQATWTWQLCICLLLIAADKKTIIISTEKAS